MCACVTEDVSISPLPPSFPFPVPPQTPGHAVKFAGRKGTSGKQDVVFVEDFLNFFFPVGSDLGGGSGGGGSSGKRSIASNIAGGCLSPESVRGLPALWLSKSSSSLPHNFASDAEEAAAGSSTALMKAFNDAGVPMSSPMLFAIEVSLASRAGGTDRLITQKRERVLTETSPIRNTGALRYPFRRRLGLQT